MPTETIVAVYDTPAHAALAVSDLKAAGVPPDAIIQHAKNSITSVSSTTAAVPTKGFWSNLFGGEPDHDEAVYDRSVDSGGAVVTVKVPSEHMQRVSDILEKHNPVDMDERAASYGVGTSGTTTTTTTTTAATKVAAAPVQSTAVKAGNEEVLALSEEQLAVGKRLVNRGTTRIRRFVVETPVEAAVTLHSETVSLERRPVAAGTKVADTAFTDRVIEVTETEEEAVVSKTARVTEEVVVNKAATERVETVRDTVRREDVEITRDATATTTTSTTQPVMPKAPPRV